MANTYRTVNLSSGAGVDDKKIKISIDDKQHEFIEQKLLAGSTKVSITVQDPGVIEKLLIDVDEAQVDHNSLLNYDVEEHRSIDDNSSSTTSLWSSQKTQEELDTKVDAVLSTDNAVAKFSLFSGQLQDSGVIIDDDDNMTIPGNLTVLGVTTHIGTTILEVTDANIVINKDGTQAIADAQQAGLSIEMSDATDVILGYNSTIASKMSLGEIGSESEIITADHIQTLYNKTIDFDPTGSALTSTTVSSALIELDNDKANINLDNLESNSSGAYTLYSDLTFSQGNDTITIRGQALTPSIDSQQLSIFSGAVDGATSGRLESISGNVFGTAVGHSGNTWHGSGQIVDPSNPGNTGYVAISSGRVQSGTSGHVFIFSGAATNGGSRGVIQLDAPIIEIINGGLSMFGGDINMVSHHVTNLLDPINDQDSATKAYVDSFNSKGDLSEGTSSVLQSQVGTIVSGLSFDSLEVRSFSALVSVRITADTDVFEEYTIEGINKGSGWEISYDSTGDDSSVDFDIDNSGQIVYDSGIYINFISGNISYRAITTSII